MDRRAASWQMLRSGQWTNNVCYAELWWASETYNVLTGLCFCFKVIADRAK
jgi:hypothetical protein